MIAPVVGIAVIFAGIQHMADHVAFRVIGLGNTQMLADPPIDDRCFEEGKVIQGQSAVESDAGSIPHAGHDVAE